MVQAIGEGKRHLIPFRRGHSKEELQCRTQYLVMLRIILCVSSYLGGPFPEALVCFSLGLQLYIYIKTTWKKE